MIGPTGSGKTYFTRDHGKDFKCSFFAIADATSLTEAGYVGEDGKNILLKLIEQQDYDIERAEYGIIYILMRSIRSPRKSERMFSLQEMYLVKVRRRLFKILEGTVASVPPSGRKKASAPGTDPDQPPISCLSAAKYI